MVASEGRGGEEETGGREDAAGNSTIGTKKARARNAPHVTGQRHSAAHGARGVCRHEWRISSARCLRVGAAVSGTVACSATAAGPGAIVARKQQAGFPDTTVCAVRGLDWNSVYTWIGSWSAERRIWALSWSGIASTGEGQHNRVRGKITWEFAAPPEHQRDGGSFACSTFHTAATTAKPTATARDTIAVDLFPSLATTDICGKLDATRNALRFVQDQKSPVRRIEWLMLRFARSGLTEETEGDRAPASSTSAQIQVSAFHPVNTPQSPSRQSTRAFSSEK